MTSEFGDLIRLMREKGTYAIPSLIFEYKLIHDHREEFEREYRALLEKPELRYLPVEDYLPMSMSYSEAGLTRAGGTLFGALDRTSEQYRRYRESYANLQHFLRAFVTAGGKVLAGTDAPNLLPPGITLHQELQLLTDAGLTPMEVVMSATRWPAEFMRQSADLGTLEPGKLADLVILRGDPLANIANTRTIDAVMLNGRILDTTYHAHFQNPIPRPISYETQTNQPPVVVAVAPRGAMEGDGDVELTVLGREFTRQSIVFFDGERVPTTFSEETRLTAIVPARLLQRAGTVDVTAWNPRPEGGTSNAVRFVIAFK
jgi:hypothetical protein